MQIGMRHHHHRLIKEWSSQFLGQSDQGPTQRVFALRQKQEKVDPEHMLNHLAEHRYHWQALKKVLLKNFERTGLIYMLCIEQLFQRTNFILLLAKLGGKPFHN